MRKARCRKSFRLSLCTILRFSLSWILEGYDLSVKTGYAVRMTTRLPLANMIDWGQEGIQAIS